MKPQVEHVRLKVVTGQPGPARLSRRELEQRLRAMDAALQRTQRRLSDLQVLAYADPLTGLQNRRAFDERLDQELARTQRSGASFGVMAIDVNDLKLINDTQGHGAGDLLIQRVADHLRATFRAYDVVCRVGGDEFQVLLPGVERRHCEAAATRLMQALPRGVSVSVGISVYGDDGKSARELVRCADAAMYAHKRLQKSQRSHGHGSLVAV
ncbi:MAG: GGDEF domain-containing protein [Myxococcaceae bacterium]|nr:GGDEF domain-containing protein [Myxococcaceae bacterium]